MKEHYCTFCGRKFSEKRSKNKDPANEICDECLNDWRKTYQSKKYGLIYLSCILFSIIVNIVFFFYLLFFFKRMIDLGVFPWIMILGFAAIFILILFEIIFYSIKR